MRTVIIAVWICCLTVPAFAQTCERLPELVGRWKVSDCDMHGLGDCAIDTTEEWVIRDDGGWIFLRGNVIVDTGSWCILPCGDTAAPDCWPGSSDRVLEISCDAGPTVGFDVGYCSGDQSWQRENCPGRWFDAEGVLSTNTVYDEYGPVIDEAVLIWEYVGLPVSNDAASWSAIKARFL